MFFFICLFFFPERQINVGAFDQLGLTQFPLANFEICSFK